MSEEIEEIELALRFVETSTPPDSFFCTRDERMGFARLMFVESVADAYDEYLVSHERSGAPVEERAAIPEWAREFVKSKDGTVVNANQLINFASGWVFPEGGRRRSSSEIEDDREARPPTKKKIKTTNDGGDESRRSTRRSREKADIDTFR